MQTANAARKRRALFALLLLLALCLTACGQVGGADIDLGPSQRFSAEELRAGAETVPVSYTHLLPASPALSSPAT